MKKIFSFDGYDTLDEIRKACGNPPGFPTEDELVMAISAEHSYEGTLQVLWRRDGVLREVELSHCSCNSYDQDAEAWVSSASLVTPQALALRPLPYDLVDSPEGTARWYEILLGRA